MKKDITAKIIIFVFFMFYLLMLDNYPVTGGDQPFYILLGKSLSIGQGYSEIWSVGNPAHTKFPFLFPVILVPVIYFWGYEFFLMRLLLVFITIGSLWLIYLFFKRLSDKLTALIVLIMTGLSSQVYYYSYHILSEIPYLFFSLLAILFVEKFRLEKRWLSKTSIFAVLLILAAYFTRTIGISLIVGSLMYLFFEREDKRNLSLSIRKVVFTGLSVFVPVLLWVLRNYRIRKTEGFEYVGELFRKQSPFHPHEIWGWGETIINNIYAFVFYAFPSVLTSIQFPHRNFAALLLSGIIFYGFLHCLVKKCLVKKRTVVEYYVILYISILFIWTWSALAGARFLLPLIPFVFYYFIVGIRKILETVKTGESLKKSLFILLIGLLVLFNIRGMVLLAVDKETYRVYSKEKSEGFIDTAKWAKNNTATSSTFGTITPAFVYLYFERKAVQIPCTHDAGKVIETIYKNKVDYIVVDSVIRRTGECLRPTIMMNSDKFIEVYRKNDNIIYKVIENKEN